MNQNTSNEITGYVISLGELSHNFMLVHSRIKKKTKKRFNDYWSITYSDRLAAINKGYRELTNIYSWVIR